MNRKPPKATRNREIAQRMVKRLIEGCRGCDFDEAEGGLVDHCAECKHAIVTDAYELFIRSGAQVKP